MPVATSSRLAESELIWRPQDERHSLAANQGEDDDDDDDDCDGK